MVVEWALGKGEVVDAFDVASLDFEFSADNYFSYILNRKQIQAFVVDIYSYNHISMELELHSVSDNNDDAFRVAEQLHSTYFSCTDSFDASDRDVPLDLNANMDAVNFYSHNIWSSSMALTHDDDCEVVHTCWAYLFSALVSVPFVEEALYFLAVAVVVAALQEALLNCDL